MNPEVFREYDVRGLVDEDLDEGFVHLLGRAIGALASRRGVRSLTLGRDCRLSSAKYLQTVGRGLIASGIDVIDIGLCATPMLYFAIRHLRTGGGVMVTGSHNPPNFNGFKICLGPDTIFGEDIQELRRIIEKSAFASGSGAWQTAEIAAAYRDFLYAHVRINPELKIVLDGGNGVGGHFALPLFTRFGCRTTELFCAPDGRFPNHFPDPTRPENLQDLIGQVVAEKADVGIAYDGDADRIGVVTDQGEILWGDVLLLLFSRFILRDHPGATVIGDVKCSQRLYDDIAARGGRPVMWKAGHSLIKEKLKAEKAMLAGEMSGHIFFADRYFGYDDAIYASVRLLEILSSSGQKLSRLLADLPRGFTTPEIRIACPDRLKFRVVDRVRDHFRTSHDVIAIDGVRIRFPEGWGLLRASNTEPVLVLRFEAATAERLAEIRSLIDEVLQASLASFS